MPPQGRVGDKAKNDADVHGCPKCAHTVIGPAVDGSSDTFVNNKPALRIGDPGVHSTCCGSNSWNALFGSKSVLINGKRAHRQFDKTKHCGGIGKLIEGSEDTIVGEDCWKCMKDAAAAGSATVTGVA